MTAILFVLALVFGLAVLPGPSPCGRTNTRIRGWMGRADQTTKVKGLFVHPHHVAEVLKRHNLDRGRLVVENTDGEDRMTLHVEGFAGDSTAIEASMRDIMKVRGSVVAAATLPNDGKVIADERKYS